MNQYEPSTKGLIFWLLAGIAALGLLLLSAWVFSTVFPEVIFG